MNKPTNILSDKSRRILSLDVIRGFAVLGMIFINIMVFVPDFKEISWHDSIVGKLTLEGALYKISYVLFHSKMRALFALLFGAGLIIFFQSKKKQTINKSDYFSRRMFFLMLFGLIHAYLLLWPGSILFEYAACGLLLFAFRGLNPKILIILSCVVLSFYIYLNSKDYSESYNVYKGYKTALQMENANQPVPDYVLVNKEKFERKLDNYLPLSKIKKEEIKENKANQIDLYRSGIKNIYEQNISTSTEALSFGVYLNILESLGTILLGMALFKLGYFEFKSRKRTHSLFILMGIPIGILFYYLLYKWQVHTKIEVLELYSWKSFSSFGIEGLARITLSLGYCSLLVWICQFQILKPILTLLGNVGKMAFTNYVGQTVICVIIFYGFRYYGRFNMTGLAIISTSIVLFQIIVSSICIKYFNTGPIEYIWRKFAQKKLSK